ncbi:MAG: DUF1830 domain-containing protein [Cyanobacteria bacterium P01_H01_bin.21]
MTQTLDPIPFDDTNTILCCYVNSSSKIQVVRVTNISNWYFERVAFPGQRLMFESNAEGQLEIHSGSMASSILEDTIPCVRLKIDQIDEVEAPLGSVNLSPELESKPSPVNAMQPVHG